MTNLILKSWFTKVLVFHFWASGRNTHASARGQLQLLESLCLILDDLKTGTLIHCPNYAMSTACHWSLNMTSRFPNRTRLSSLSNMNKMASGQYQYCHHLCINLWYSAIQSISNLAPHSGQCVLPNSYQTVKFPLKYTRVNLYIFEVNEILNFQAATSRNAYQQTYDTLLFKVYPI